MNVMKLSEEEFGKKVADLGAREWKFLGDKPAVIDFFATWCAPCKAMSPVFDELADDYAGKVDFYKVDVDEQRRLPALFGIRSVPTFVFVPVDGQPSMSSGMMSRNDMESIVNRIVPKQ